MENKGKETVKFKSCPFCGGNGDYYKRTNKFQGDLLFIKCGECGCQLGGIPLRLQSDNYNIRQIVADMWNKRVV